jgi:hypothetical protein
VRSPGFDNDKFVDDTSQFVEAQLQQLQLVEKRETVVDHLLLTLPQFGKHSFAKRFLLSKHYGKRLVKRRTERHRCDLRPGVPSPRQRVR